MDELADRFQMEDLEEATVQGIAKPKNKAGETIPLDLLLDEANPGAIRANIRV
jgi:hypothetical protein